MARTARRTIGFILLTVLGLGAVAAALSDVTFDDAPEISIAALEAGERPVGDQARVNDGWLVWSRAVYYGDQDLRTEAIEIEGYYVPVVSKARAEALQHEDAPLGDVRLVVHIHRETAEAEFPGLDGDAPIPTAAPVIIHGPLQPGRTLDHAVKSDLDDLLPGLDLEKVALLDHNPPDERLAGILGSLLLAVLIGAWAFAGGRKEDDAPDEASLQDERALDDVVLGDAVRDDAQARRFETVG